MEKHVPLTIHKHLFFRHLHDIAYVLLVFFAFALMVAQFLLFDLSKTNTMSMNRNMSWFFLQFYKMFWTAKIVLHFCQQDHQVSPLDSKPLRWCYAG